GVATSGRRRISATQRRPHMSHSRFGASELTKGNTTLLEMIYAFELSRAICAAAELGIADLLNDGPVGIDQLAAATGTRPHLLFRLLRALATRGVFEQRDDGRFALTPLSASLRSDADGPSAYGYALYVGQPFLQRSWEQLVATLRTGKPAFELTH